MRKSKIAISFFTGLGLAALTMAFLSGLNLTKKYEKGEYVPAENAYFSQQVKNKAGFIQAKPSVVPTDNKYNTQKTRFLGTSLIGDIENVWSSYTGKGTKIAIIDDGFDYNHPEYRRQNGQSAILPNSRYYYLSGSSVYFQEFSDNPSCIAEKWGSDGHGGYAWATHGTATSTTAAAPMNNGGGVGIAPEADILALKTDMKFASLESAIEYAVSQGVDVINMSLGAYADTFVDGWGDSQEGYEDLPYFLEDVCEAAYNAGIIVVASAGNESTWHKSYPACNYKVIGVGATGDWDNKGNSDVLAEFTNYVKSDQTGEVNVDILAPGYSYTAHQSGTQYSPTHVYDDIQGTSFSSPIIAGAACLWKQKYPNGTPDQFLQELQSTADGIGYYADKYVPVSGWYDELDDVGPSEIENGRLNVANLLEIDEPFVSTVQTNLNISIGEQRQIDLDTFNGVISYSSSDTSVATVNSSGVVEGVSAGNATITVTATKNNKTATTTVAVRVSNVISCSSLSFDPKTVTIGIGDTYDAEATINVSPANASRLFLFASGNENVATVDEETGLVRGVGVGSTTIEAVSVYGDGYDTLTVTVENTNLHTGSIYFGNADGKTNINGVSINGTDSLSNTWSITTGRTSSFTPNADYSQIGSSNNPASNITFSLTLPSSATFSDVSASFGGFNNTAGNIAIKVGSTTIGSGSLSASSDVVVNSTSSAEGTNLSILVTNISKGVKAYGITYSYTSSGVAPSPTVTSVTVSPSVLNLDLYGNASGSLSATVNGTNSPSQSVIWSSGNNSIATVSNSGVVTALATGSTTITATSTVDPSKSGSCSLTVIDSTPAPKTLSSISISGYTTAFIVNSPFSFGGTVTANFSDDSHEDVTNSCTFSGYNMTVAGNYTVTVSYTYAATTKTATYDIVVSASSINQYSSTFSYSNVGTTWSLTNYDSQNQFLLCPNGNNSTSIALLNGIFEGKDIMSDVAITIDCATYGNGNNPSESTFSVYSDSACSSSVSSAMSGTLPTSSTYKEVTYTVSQANAFASFSDDLAIKITKPGKQIRLRSITVSFEYAVSDPKIIASLSASYNGGNVFVGRNLNESALTVTASYTNSQRYQDAVLPSSDYTLTGFSSASAGTKTVTVTYIGALEVETDPMATTFEVTVVVDSVSNVTITNNKTYHPGETISKSDLTVNVTRLSGESGVVNDFTFDSDGYRFTYEDAYNGGANATKHFTISYEGIEYGFDVKVNRVAYSPINNPSTTLSSSQFHASDVSSSSSTPSNSNVTIGGIAFTVTTNAYIYQSSSTYFLSFGKTAGSISNANPFDYDLLSVGFNIRSGARTDGVISISKNGEDYVPYSMEETAKGGYRYFKIAYEGSSDSYSNISSITFTLRGQDNVVNVANYIMYEDTENQCLTKLDLALDKLNNMSSSDKNTFWTSENYVISSARERVLAWSVHQGKELIFEDGRFQFNGVHIASAPIIFNENNDTGAMVFILFATALLSFGGYAFFRKKKEE